MKNILFLILVTVFCHAHPHTFIDVDVNVSGDKHIDKITIQWKFDEMTSQTLLADFDADTNGLMDAKETLDFKKTVFDDLIEFSYFTHLKIAGKKVNISPIDLQLFKKQRYFIVQFSLNLKSFSTQKKSIGFWDENNMCALKIHKAQVHSAFPYVIKEVDNAYYYGYLLEL